jgi:hypothetical protein
MSDQGSKKHRFGPTAIADEKLSDIGFATTINIFFGTPGRPPNGGGGMKEFKRFAYFHALVSIS